MTLQFNPTVEPPQAWYDFGFTSEPTVAVISAVRSRIEDGVAHISWDVMLELGTIGYYLERKAGDDWVRVSQAIIESDPFEPAPKSYEQADSDAPLGTVQEYRIVEVAGPNQVETIYGPWVLELDGGEVSYATWAAGIDWGDADSSPDADPDGDGMTNFEEYLAGTDPLNANSVLRVSRLEPTDGGLRLTWQSVEGRLYVVQMALTLEDGFWPVTPQPVPGNEDETHYVVPFGDPDALREAFFRVIVK